MPVVNSAGRVALKWTINPNGKTVNIADKGRFYVFTPKHHVVMEWVLEEDVERLLAIRQKTCNCANGIFKQAFDYANLLDVNLWSFGDRHGSLQSDYREISDG